MNTNEIKKQILGDIASARSFFEDSIEPKLLTRHQIYEADREYYKKRFPNLSVQSDLVSYDMWSYSEWAVPRIMNSFFNGGEAVVILGRTSEDVERAELLKALVDFQVMVQNKGFILLWDWFKDAIKYNLGAIKITWKRRFEWEEETIGYAPIDRIHELMGDPNKYQVIELRPVNLEFGLFDITYRVKRVKENRPHIEQIPVTDLRWSSEAKSISDANFVAHRKIVTGDYLRRQARAGVYEPEAIESALEKGSDGHGQRFMTMEKQLNPELEDYKASDSKGRNLYELHECYVKTDLDGDGILEDTIVSVVGDEVVKVQENKWGRIPIFTISPIRDGFKVLGSMSINEIVGEVQSIKVAMIRQMIINLANANDPQTFIDETKVNTDDIVDRNAFIRVKGTPQGAVVPVQQASLSPSTMPFMEYLENQQEEWTGKTRYNQGMDSKSLNKTATGITLLTQASNQRIDYIVRVFAETGVGEMIRFIVELNQRYIDQETVIRLKNKPLTIAPDDIDGDFDVDVNTEAGVGRREQLLQSLQFYVSTLGPMAIQMGAATPAEWAKVAIKLIEESGIRNPEQYIKDPEELKQELIQQGIAQVLQSGLPAMLQQMMPGVPPEAIQQMLTQIMPQLLQASQMGGSAVGQGTQVGGGGTGIAGE